MDKRKKELIRCTVLLIVSLACGAALALAPETAAAGAGTGLQICLSVLAPSLFPFLVLSVFAVRCGAAALLGRLLERPIRFLFRLPGSCAAVLLMGLIGGYPVGARGAAALLRSGQITEREAERLCLFCVNAGPAFVLSAVGAGFLHSRRAGAILLLSGLLGSLALGLLLRGRGPLPKAERREAARETAGEAIVSSAADACRSLVSLCCFVVLFSTVLAFVRPLLPPGPALPVISALLEVTGGCRDLALAGAPLWAMAAALGWGGLSVHLQIRSMPGTPRLSALRFALARALHGALAALFAFLLNLWFPLEGTAQPVFSPLDQPQGALGGSPAASAALLAACAAFLLSCSVPRLLPPRQGRAQKLGK